jgi:hypothetical protein
MTASSHPLTWHSTDRRVAQQHLPETCTGVASTHDQHHPRPYIVGPQRRPLVLCDGCRATVRLMTDCQPDPRSIA